MKEAASIEAWMCDAAATSGIADDLRGVVRLVIRGVTATTDLAEHVHANIQGFPGRLLGGNGSRSTRGIPRIAYQGVRKLANLVGSGIDEALAMLAPHLGGGIADARREALIAALNGVVGDHLHASGNPLALQARLRLDGRVLPLDGHPWPPTSTTPTPRLLVQVHGLCMNHLQWRHRGHDHGQRLAATLGYTPVHLHYNSGLSIADNGEAFSALLQRLFDEWPLPIERFAILGHSMGGLVARAAIASAQRERMRWVEQLDRIVFLGTPHHGAPLERAGHALQSALGLTPFTAPFVQLGQLRSAGIQDLRHGLRGGAALPANLEAYAVAGSMQGRHGRLLRGDGLVPVRSALGEHRDPALALPIPPSHRLLVERTGHLELLSSPAVQARLQDWLA